MEGKGWMWVNTLLNSLYDPKLRPHQWPLNWIFNVKFSNNHSPGMEEPIDIERKDCESHIMLESPRHLELWHQTWFDIQVLDFKGLNFRIWYFSNRWFDWYQMKEMWISRMMLTLCDLSHDLGRGFSRLHFKNYSIWGITSDVKCMTFLYH